MNKRVASVIALAALTFVAGALWAQQGALPAAAAQQGTTVTPLEAGGVKNPVVACAPYTYTTENDEDPFNADRIRRTRTTVTSVVVVHADGTAEVRKPTGG